MSSVAIGVSLGCVSVITPNGCGPFTRRIPRPIVNRTQLDKAFETRLGQSTNAMELLQSFEFGFWGVLKSPF